MKKYLDFLILLAKYILLPPLAILACIFVCLAAKTAWEKTLSTKTTEDKTPTRDKKTEGLLTDERQKLLKAAGFDAKDSRDNPFITGHPVRYGHFFGREEILHDLFNLWKEFPNMPIQNAAIYGDRRIGKTSLLLHLKDMATAHSKDARLRKEQKVGDEWLPNSKHYCWIFVSFQDAEFSNQKRLLEYILTNMKLEKASGLDLSLSNENPLLEFSQIVSHHLIKPTLILLDEIDVALDRYQEEFDNAFWEGLRTLAITKLYPQCLGFVLASKQHPIELGQKLADGKGSPFFNIFGHVVKLEPLTEKDAKELIASSPKPFSEEDVQFILEKSECQPYLLQILCQIRLNYLRRGDTSNRWQTEAEERLNKIKK
jgi:hypothetical protein